MTFLFLYILKNKENSRNSVNNSDCVFMVLISLFVYSLCFLLFVYLFVKLGIIINKTKLYLLLFPIL